MCDAVVKQNNILLQEWKLHSICVSFAFSDMTPFPNTMSWGSDSECDFKTWLHSFAEAADGRMGGMMQMTKDISSDTIDEVTKRVIEEMDGGIISFFQGIETFAI